MQSHEGQPIVERSLAEKARGAAIALYCYYASSHSQIDVGEVLEPETMTEQEAEQKLHALAQDLIDGRTKSHIGIARVIRSLDGKMGPGGGASANINNAVLEVEEVILDIESKLKDSPAEKIGRHF